MNWINLKTATAIAAVLTMVASFAPEAAEARRGGGRSQQDLQITLDLNTLDNDVNKDENLGEYLKGILDFNVSGGNDPTPDDPDGLDIPYGNLKVSIIDNPVPTNFLGYNNNFTYQDLFEAGKALEQEGFEQGVLRYDITFDNQPDLSYQPKLSLFLPSTGDPLLDKNQFINSLSGLDDPNLTQIVGVYAANGFDIGFGFKDSSNNAPISLGAATAVPEPTNTAGVLAFGTLGAISLLKRNRRFNKYF